MANVKHELQKVLSDNHKTTQDIAYGVIRLGYYLDGAKIFELGTDIAINTLDEHYDNGYGAQELFGYIVFTDGTWLERHEYDGSEWWEFKRTPTLDEVMLIKTEEFL